MKVKLVGVSDLDFVTDDGKAIQGTKFYVLAPSKNVVGFKPFDFFVSSANSGIIAIKLTDFLGKDVDLEVDLKGKPISVTAI